MTPELLFGSKLEILKEPINSKNSQSFDNINKNSTSQKSMQNNQLDIFSSRNTQLVIEDPVIDNKKQKFFSTYISQNANITSEPATSAIKETE